MEGTLAALEGATTAQQAQQQAQQAQQQPQQAAAPGGMAGQQQQAQQGAQPMALSPLPEERAAGGGEQPPAPAPGWGLHDNLDVLACRAEWLYHRQGGPWLGREDVAHLHERGEQGVRQLLCRGRGTWA